MKKIIALLLALVLVFSVAGCGQDNTTQPDDSDSTTGATDTTESTDSADKDDSQGSDSDDPIFLRDSYSVSDEEAIAQHDTVVATIGDSTLTNGVLQLYYWSGVYSFLNENYYYIYYYGLDLASPLDEQDLPDGEEGTWQQYFLSDALAVWHRYQALALKNDQLALEMDPELQAELDETEKLMQDSAEEGGFASVDEMLVESMGAGATLQDYLEYTEQFYRSYNYYLYKYNQIEISDQQIEEYFNEHEEELAESGVTKETMQYAVRHILIEPEGGTEDEYGNVTYSDDEMSACKDAAQKLLDQWLAGDATEESFAELAKEHSTDTGSAENGGLYEGLTEDTSFVESFKEWYLDDSRKPGDYGLVESTYGYHIMYFSGSDTLWQDYCKEILLYDESTAFINETVEEFPMTTEYDKIALPEVALS